MSVTLDLARDLLDRQIVDAEDRPCGKVDDIELEEVDGGGFRLTFLLSGPGAAARRLPHIAGALYRWIAGTHVARIPWDAVDHVSAMVHLKKSADVAGLFRGEQLAGRVLERIPGS